MAGSIAGGKRAAQTNRQKHGTDFYAVIGAIGGRLGRTGGFASHKIGSDGLTGRQRAMLAGQKGGTISRKPRKKAV